MSTTRDAGEVAEVSKADLVAAWKVLENLAVSLDQIGGAFGRPAGIAPDADGQRALGETLGAYLSPALVAAIQDARTRLANYVPRAEAEDLSETIPYWDYSTYPSPAAPSRPAPVAAHG